MEDLMVFLIMLIIIGLSIVIEKHTGVAEIAPAVILGSMFIGAYLGLSPSYIACLAALIPGYRYLLLIMNKIYRVSGGLKVLWGSLLRYSVYIVFALGLSLILAGKKLEYMGAWGSETLYVFIVFTALTATLDPRSEFFTWMGDKLKRDLPRIEDSLIMLGYVLGIMLLLTIIFYDHLAGLSGLVLYVASIALRRRDHKIMSNVLLALSMYLPMFFLILNP